MEILRRSCNYGFYISLKGYFYTFSDRDYIAAQLNIEEEKLSNFIKLANGMIVSQSGCEYPFFINENDLEKFIEYLQPYIIMKELST